MTKFATIYERTVFKFRDYSFLTIPETIKEGVLLHYLLSAITDFQHSCVNYDLTDYDIEKETFNIDLSDEVIEVLALGIVYHWFKSRILDVKLLRNKMLPKDWTTYSPGNLLSSMSDVLDRLEQEYRGKINSYSFRYSDVGSLKV